MAEHRSPAAVRRGYQGHFDRGAAAVEMALVMPLLILMVMGIIDFGRIFNGEIQLSQAAREGARVAALGFPENPDVLARTRAALNNPAFQGGIAGVSVAVVDANGNAATRSAGVTVNVCVTSDPLDVANNYAQVTVSISYKEILFGPGNLSQKAVMKCSG